MVYRSFILVAGLSSLFYACTNKDQDPRTQTQASSEAPPCVLPSGQYPVQSASHYPQSGKYEFMLLGAPGCLKMPYEISSVTLARMEDTEKESALFELGADGAGVLKIKKDFSIQLVQLQPSAAKDGTQETQTSSWAPFLQGAATAAVGGMLVNSLMNRPGSQASAPVAAPAPAQVTPRPSQALNRPADPHTTHSYQRQNQPSKGFFKAKPQTAPARRSGGFFKRR